MVLDHMAFSEEESREWRVEGVICIRNGQRLGEDRRKGFEWGGSPNERGKTGGKVVDERLK